MSSIMSCMQQGRVHPPGRQLSVMAGWWCHPSSTNHRWAEAGGGGGQPSADLQHGGWRPALVTQGCVGRGGGGGQAKGEDSEGGRVCCAGWPSAHKDVVMTVDWSRDGKRLSSGGLDKQVGEGPREEERRRGGVRRAMNRW